jgi:hypothetical protein
MTLKLSLLILALALFAGVGFSQTAKPSKQTTKLKTIRVHIDGFQKSKSGAI